MARRQTFIDIGLATLVAVTLLGGLAPAHTVSDYYGYKWAPSDRNQDYGFASDVPNNNYRDRVEGGAIEWNNLPGDMRFGRGGVNVNFAPNAASCPNRQLGDNGIHDGYIDGDPVENDTIAYMQPCPLDADHYKAFSIKFDNGNPWYNGTESPSDGELDRWSVAAHEFGHAGGFGSGALGDHFAANLSICSYSQPSTRHTMCSGTPKGTTYRRSLEEHDKHTFNNAYP